MYAIRRRDVILLSPTRVECDFCGAEPLTPCRVKGKPLKAEWSYEAEVHWVRVWRRDGYLDGYKAGFEAAKQEVLRGVEPMTPSNPSGY